MSGFEDYKHVMLSEPPQRSNHSGNVNHSYGGGGMGAGTFENYKGVLLCERPSHASGNLATERPFLPPGQTGSYTGLPPSLEDQKRHAVAKRILAHKKMPCQAQIQYRKLLKDMGEKQRSQVAEDVVEPRPLDRRRKEERQPENRAENSARQHKMQHDMHAAYDTADDARSADSWQKEQQQRITRAETMIEEARPPNRPKKEKEEKAKPRWAMTEEEADDADDKMAEKLLKYVGKLDVEKYLDDFEVKEALSIIQERINELKENEDKASVTDSQFSDRKNYGDNPFNSFPDDGPPPLQPAAHIPQVTVVEPPPEATIPINALVLPAVPNPIITHGDVGPKRYLLQLKNSKDYVQNLPYMYRCPSI